MAVGQYPIHPDFGMWAHMRPPLIRPMLPVMQGMLGALYRLEKSDSGVRVDRLEIPVEGGASVRALLYSPTALSGKAPCLIDYHGGGFVFPAAPYHYALAREYARRASCRVLMIDYRLAPKHPFPAAPNDCWEAYLWVRAHAEELLIDADRIAVGGDSAGGQLAATVCLMARDRKESKPCMQLLIYPCVGRDAPTESMKRFTDTPMCCTRDMEKYERFYMSGAGVGDSVYAAPMKAETLRGLPPAYVETAEFDCLHDEGILYARRLEEAGVPVETNETKGTMHGFDIVMKSPIVQRCIDRRVEFLIRGWKKA